jgi:diguanylate cyclase (GGDEF)-like protein
MIDIDHFKSINDRFGHSVGDDALVWIARACQESKRSSDIIGRIGGEEFALLLPETDLEQARVVAERLRKKASNYVMTSGGTNFNVTLSIGLATATLSMSGIDVVDGARSRHQGAIG